MTSAEQLTRALLDLATRGQRPRCGDPVTRDLWTSEDREERQLAASWRTGCPVLDECHAAGAGETFGVWAGVDRTKAQRKRKGSSMNEDPRELADDDLSHHLDPDWDDVPPELATRDGTQVLIDGEPGTLVVVPGLHGHARRCRDGFYDPDTQEENQP